MATSFASLEQEITKTDWTDWKWQQRQAIRTVDQLVEYYPNLSREVVEVIQKNSATRRMQLTPYFLRLIRRDASGAAPLNDDPLWRQVVPAWDAEGAAVGEYDGKTENWEMPSEMVTPIAQRKYSNRVIVRLANVCHGYCQFCYEALRTLEKDSSKLGFNDRHWADTIEFLHDCREIEEVILSGGEPLMHNDEQLDRVLGDLRDIGRPIAIRIHTRAMTFNPFRITPGLIDILARHELNSLGLHVSHPHEISQEFRDKVKQLRAATPILFANIPLLRGVNDNVECMHTLGMTLYSAGVLPHYLYHFMPFSPGASHFRTSVRSGIEIVRSLKRHVTNLAVPEFVLPHHSGKHALPLLAEDEAPPEWDHDASGNAVVRYTNWRGDVVEYLDYRP